jgi:uncharacterized protein (DUF2252 family)
MKRPICLFLAAFTQCATPNEGTPRRAWLQQSLIDDNFALLRRSPELVADKFQKMSLSPFAFFRGTIGQFVRDQTEPGPGFIATQFVTRDSLSVAVLGDPHPENIGTFRSAAGIDTLDFNDFDGATYGPYLFDVRRLALSLYIAAETITLSDIQQDDLILAALQGYTSEIESQASGLPPTIFREGQSGAIFDELLQDAREDGEAKKELVEFTRVINGSREMFFGELSLGNSVEEVSADEIILLQNLIARYPSSLLQERAGLVFKGASRRFGAGVSSLPLLRYYVLLEGETLSLDDDLLLEVKEVRDPPAYLSEMALFPTRPFLHNADRIVALTRELQEFTDEDALLGFAAEGAASFRIRQLTEHQQDIKVQSLAEDFAAGDLSFADLLLFAEKSGRLLACSHARAQGLSTDGLSAIHEALHGDTIGFINETLSFTRQYGALVLSDYQDFLLLLSEEGPLLGYLPR